MLHGGAVPLVNVVLLGDRKSRDDMDEPPKQHGDLTSKTDVVHRGYGLDLKNTSKSTEIGGDWVLDHVRQALMISPSRT